MRRSSLTIPASCYAFRIVPQFETNSLASEAVTNFKRSCGRKSNRSRDVFDDSLLKKEVVFYCESGLGGILINCLPNRRASTE